MTKITIEGSGCSGMTPTEMSAALAEELGWKRGGIWGNFWVSPDGREYQAESGVPFPNYAGDRNAMRDAIETLRHKDGPAWYDLGHLLMEFYGSQMNRVQAEAEVLAEMFLSAVGRYVYCNRAGDQA